MSTATWIAAKRKSFEWRRIWPAWRNRNKPSHEKSFVAATERPLALVGSYEYCDGLDRAAEAFAQAAFGCDDAVFVRAAHSAENGLWAKLYAWGRTRLGREAPPETPGSDIPMELSAAGRLLSSSAGFVLVRSAARFHEACEIIERTGGRVGCV